MHINLIHTLYEIGGNKEFLSLNSNINKLLKLTQNFEFDDFFVYL